jgi:hypothetical protein
MDTAVKKPLKAFKTPKEFAEAYGMSYSKFKRLVAEGVGPKCTLLGGTYVIFEDDEAEWVALMQNPVGRVAKFRAETQARLYAKGKKAAAAAAEAQQRKPWVRRVAKGRE